MPFLVEFVVRAAVDRVDLPHKVGSKAKVLARPQHKLTEAEDEGKERTDFGQYCEQSHSRRFSFNLLVAKAEFDTVVAINEVAFQIVVILSLGRMQVRIGVLLLALIKIKLFSTFNKSI